MGFSLINNPAIGYIYQPVVLLPSILGSTRTLGDPRGPPDFRRGSIESIGSIEPMGSRHVEGHRDGRRIREDHQCLARWCFERVKNIGAFHQWLMGFFHMVDGIIMIIWDYNGIIWFFGMLHGPLWFHSIVFLG